MRCPDWVVSRRRWRVEAADPPATLAAARGCLQRLAAHVTENADSSHLEPDSEALAWLETLQRQCRDALDEIELLAPWSALPALPERFTSGRGSRRDPYAARDRSASQ